MSFFSKLLVLIVFVLLAGTSYVAAKCGDPPKFDSSEIVRMTCALIEEVVAESYPELRGREFKIEIFNSESTFFKTRFSFTKLLTFRRAVFIVGVNPKAFESGASKDALRAIIAHELAHADLFRTNGGFKAFGMIGLLNARSLAKFERRADLVAIEKGYGHGLKAYREWLYKNVPKKYLAKKMRNYFSPTEIELILFARSVNSDIISKLMKDVPLSLVETKAATENK